MRGLVGVVMVLFALQAMSQDLLNQIRPGVGGSLKIGGVKTILKLKEDVDVTGTPVFSLAYSRRVSSSFDVGAEFTSQDMAGSYLFDVDVAGTTIKETMSFTYSRRAIVFHGNYIYPIESDIIEVYSGIRLGIKRENVVGESSQSQINELAKLADLLDGFGVNPSVVPLGISIFPIKNFGINITSNIGPTYFANAGIIIRF